MAPPSPPLSLSMPISALLEGLQVESLDSDTIVVTIAGSPEGVRVYKKPQEHEIGHRTWEALQTLCRSFEHDRDEQQALLSFRDINPTTPLLDALNAISVYAGGCSTQGDAANRMLAGDKPRVLRSGVLFAQCAGQWFFDHPECSALQVRETPLSGGSSRLALYACMQGIWMTIEDAVGTPDAEAILEVPILFRMGRVNALDELGRQRFMDWFAPLEQPLVTRDNLLNAAVICMGPALAASFRSLQLEKTLPKPECVASPAMRPPSRF